jgi:N-acetyl-anhydromuramyl-L-alanine amidase AmpD
MNEHLAPLTQHPSPNFSSRRGARITHLVWHATEGHYGPSIAWLCDPAANASAHLVVEEHGEESSQLVHLADKAWHCEAWNAFTIGVEHASLNAGFETHDQLQQSARLFGWLCKTHKIPPLHGLHRPKGIVRHRDLGAAGGGHHDGPSDSVWFGEYLPLVHLELARDGYRKEYAQ